MSLIVPSGNENGWYLRMSRALLTWHCFGSLIRLKKSVTCNYYIAFLRKKLHLFGEAKYPNKYSSGIMHYVIEHNVWNCLEWFCGEFWRIQAQCVGTSFAYHHRNQSFMRYSLGVYRNVKICAYK